MSRILKQYLEKLTTPERVKLEALAEKAGLSVEEWVDFRTKAQIYHNAEEILAGEEAA